jgi:hypothetical protein
MRLLLSSTAAFILALLGLVGLYHGHDVDIGEAIEQWEERTEMNMNWIHDMLRAMGVDVDLDDLHVSVDGEPAECKQENITVSGNGNVKQSSSSVIIQKSGNGSTTVYCSQTNVTTESR